MLASLDAETVADLLRAEHPQVVAVVLSYLDPKKSAEIIDLFDSVRKTDVVYRIANLKNVSAEITGDLDKYFSNEIQSLTNPSSQKTGGVQAVASIMKHLNESTDKQLLANLDNYDTSLTEKIRHTLFDFKYLSDLNDRDMQIVLKEIPNKDLALALKQGYSGLKEKILSNMSPRLAQMLKEDIETIASPRPIDIENAQTLIMKTVKKLKDSGRIDFK